MIRLGGGLDVVFGRKAVAELSFAIAAPDDAIDRDWLRPGESDAPLPLRIGDPALAVAGASVIEMSDLVDRGIGIFRRGRGPAAGACQGDISRRLRSAGWSRVNLDLVEARLDLVAGGQNREPHHPGSHGCESLNVAPEVDHRPRRAILGLDAPGAPWHRAAHSIAASSARMMAA